MGGREGEEEEEEEEEEEDWGESVIVSTYK